MSFSLYLIEQTNYCNLRCVGCPNRLGLSPRGFMSTETFSMVCDQILRVGGHHFRMALHGTGEPLMSPHLFEHLAILDQLRFDNVDFSTNGVLLTRGVAERIVGYKCLSWFRISLNSSNPALMERINTGAKFERVVENTRGFLDVWAREGKPFRLVIQLMRTRANPQETEQDIYALFGRDDFEVMVKKYNTFAGLTKENELAFPGWPGRTKCHYGDDIYVHWDGDIVGCCFDPTKWQVCGHVSDGIFSHKVRGRTEQLAQALGRGDYSELPLCRMCRNDHSQ